MPAARLQVCVRLSGLGSSRLGYGCEAREPNGYAMRISYMFMQDKSPGLAKFRSGKRANDDEPP